MANANSQYDVFISYRRDGGFETARHLYDLLTRDGYSVSFDLDTLRSGRFDTALLSRIDKCTDFIIVLSPGCFDRTLAPDFPLENDWLRQELARALKMKKNVVPVMLAGFDAFPEGLPDDVKEVAKMTGPKYSKEYFDSFYVKVKKFLMSRRRARGAETSDVQGGDRPKGQLCSKRTAKMPWKWLLMALMVSIAATGGLLVWDALRTVKNYYADYVDSFGLPEGIFPLEESELQHRQYHYSRCGYKVAPTLYVETIGAHHLCHGKRCGEFSELGRLDVYRPEYEP